MRHQLARPRAEPTSRPAPTTSTVRRTLNGELVIGTLLPRSGPAAALGPPLVAAVRLAVAQANASGGVGGCPVRLVEADDGGDPAPTTRCSGGDG